jgi:hypothetical protein
MPNFALEIPVPPRFDGDFWFAPNSGYVPTPAEQAYLDAVNAVVSRLAADELADKAANYSEQLLSARRAARTAAVSALKIEAHNFAAGQNPAADPARVTEISNQFATRIPRFGTTKPSSER